MELSKEIKSKEDFLNFIINFKESCGDGENDTLDSFISGLEGFVTDLEGYKLNVEPELDIENFNWGILATILAASKNYE